MCGDAGTLVEFATSEKWPYAGDEISFDGLLIPAASRPGTQGPGSIGRSLRQAATMPQPASPNGSLDSQRELTANSRQVLIVLDRS
jgi:hypothetical protein